MPEYKHVPKGYSQTGDCFAGCLGGAPLFRTNGMTIQQAFGRLSLGIDSVIAKAKHPEALRLLTTAKSEVLAVRDMFQENSERVAEKDKAARLRLSRAYYDLYKKAGQLLRPGVELGPDDDI